MLASEVRKKYLDYFKKRGHKEIPASPLVLENDQTTLFTSSGMQQLIPFLKGEKHPQGKRLVDSQPSLRMQDLEEVGDNRHTTFFEMLGNWSLFQGGTAGLGLGIFYSRIRFSKKKTLRQRVRGCTRSASR